ncbi:hypothetical protein AB0P15_30910 [Streptomyces sp. NPDC087917]|uniref:hypothetical protein n=1 Tax=Streptomyces sp. NPDC087917 TaxID=3155060 RepID=UPI003419849B
MASDIDWKLSHGSARVYLANPKNGLRRPLIVLADGGHGETDLSAFQTALDDPSYSFITQARRRGNDVILVGYSNGEASLKDHARVVMEVVMKAISERMGNAPLTVGGIGRGALATRYALAQAESMKMDHQSATYFSFDGTAPSQEEKNDLERLGDWPFRPRKFSLVSDGFTSELNSEDFDDSIEGAADSDEALITEKLGSWLLERLQQY